MVGSKNAFWQAFIFTIVVFGIGILFGFFLEGSRADHMELNLLNSEISLIDAQMRANGIGQFGADCSLAKDSVFDFADDVYGEVRELEKYDSRAKLDSSLRVLHKRYDLLRMLLWAEGIELKEQCTFKEIHTIVYIFDYASEDIGVNAKQASLSRLLADLKNVHSGEVLLIPFAGNLNLSSIDLVLNRYGISELPVIIVDENKIVSDSVSLSELEDIIFEREGFKDLEGVVFEKPLFETNEMIILNGNNQ